MGKVCHYMATFQPLQQNTVCNRPTSQTPDIGAHRLRFQALFLTCNLLTDYVSNEIRQEEFWCARLFLCVFLHGNMEFPLPSIVIVIAIVHCHTTHNLVTEHSVTHRADSRFAPSQWETVLFCNDVSHWLGASLESALDTYRFWFWMFPWFKNIVHFVFIKSGLLD